MTPTTTAEKVKEIAYDAWKAAANAYRLYPDNKHTFAAYWHTEGSRLVGELVEGEKEDWISADDKLPDTEGQYECCKYYKLVTNKEWTYVIYISNFKFFRMRETNEIVIGQDGETGCFSDNLGYAQFPTHWRNIPEPPKIN